MMPDVTVTRGLRLARDSQLYHHLNVLLEYQILFLLTGSKCQRHWVTINQ
jgi:hypothetical protein